MPQGPHETLRVAQILGGAAVELPLDRAGLFQALASTLCFATTILEPSECPLQLALTNPTKLERTGRRDRRVLAPNTNQHPNSALLARSEGCQHPANLLSRDQRLKCVVRAHSRRGFLVVERWFAEVCKQLVDARGPIAAVELKAHEMSGVLARAQTHRAVRIDHLGREAVEVPPRCHDPSSRSHGQLTAG